MMFKSSILAVAVACLTVLSVTPSVEAHVGLSMPCPRYGPFKGCPAPPKGQSIDYNINAPVGTHDKINQPLCKSLVPGTVRSVYEAGQVFRTDYSIGIAHGGGHCQWALSYDNGGTWVVIQTIIRDCLLNVTNGAPYSINVTIPSNAPSANNVILQWIWNNAVGDRELYSNCADINIKGTNGGNLTGVAPLIANYGPNSLFIPEFPNPEDKDGHEAFDNRGWVTITVPKMMK